MEVAKTSKGVSAGTGPDSPDPHRPDALDAFLCGWLKQHAVPMDFRAVSDLAQLFREEARDREVDPQAIERRLGATIEEALFDAVNVMCSSLSENDRGSAG